MEVFDLFPGKTILSIDAFPGKTILSIAISDDKETMTFHCIEGDVIAICYAQCCSSTWIEHVEYPALGFPAKVLKVEELDLPGSENKHPVHDCLQVYGYKISTEKGDLIIDFRNSSNGYYGGSLDWKFKPKETTMSTTEQESINHIRQTSETLNTIEPLFDANGDVSEYYKSLSRAARKAIWISRVHPKFIAAQLESKKRAEERVQQETDLRAVQDMSGFRFLVFDRLTVCYRRAKSVLYISTILRNQKDKDDPLAAKMGAAYRMVEGQYIVVPIHPKNSAMDAIKTLFFFV